MEVLEPTEIDGTTSDPNEPEPADHADDVIGNAIRFAINQHICED